MSRGTMRALKWYKCLGLLPFHRGASKPIPVLYGTIPTIFPREIGGASDYAPEGCDDLRA